MLEKNTKCPSLTILALKCSLKRSLKDTALCKPADCQQRQLCSFHHPAKTKTRAAYNPMTSEVFQTLPYNDMFKLSSGGYAANQTL